MQTTAGVPAQAGVTVVDYFLLEVRNATDILETQHVNTPQLDGIQNIFEVVQNHIYVLMRSNVVQKMICKRS